MTPLLCGWFRLRKSRTRVRKCGFWKACDAEGCEKCGGPPRGGDVDEWWNAIW